MANNPSLLPPNATRLEHALASATARIGQIPTPLTELWRPDAIPASILPWLAWGLSVDRWRPSWSEAQRRAATAAAIPNAKIRGSRGAAETVITDYDPLITLTEWWEPGGSGIPFTFWVDLPIDGSGAIQSTADFANGLAADITRVKPARAHFQIRQRAAAISVLPMAAVARSFTFSRFRAVTGTDFSIDTENGEPLEGDDSNFLEAQ